MEPIHLDLALATSLVNQAIEEKGSDHVYEKAGNGNCQYVHLTEIWHAAYETYEENEKDLTPGCLVGLALIKAGIPMSAFLECNTEGVQDVLSSLRNQEYIKSYSTGARQFLMAVQASQDNGATWGEAREMATRGVYVTALGDERPMD